MKTKEELIMDSVNYLDKCSKHLFVIHPKHGKKYYHVYSIMKDEKYYSVRLEFDLTTTKVFGRVSELCKYGGEDSHYLSQSLFTELMESKAIRQNKFLKSRLGLIKERLSDKITPGAYQYNFEMEFENEVAN